MATFKFTLPNGKPFEVKGPAGLSFDQARAIFDKQAETGSLVGIKPGEVLSAATQAAQGLASAQALVSQAQSGIIGALGAGIPGAAGAIGAVSGALGAAGGALGGSLAGTATGLTGAVGAAVTNFTSAATEAIGTVTSTLGRTARLPSRVNSVLGSGRSLTAVAGSIGATASATISTINKSLTSAVTDPINIANFAKETPALTSIGSMNAGVVTGVLAQAKNLVGQASSALTNEKGLGSFGLGAEQLEKAGILKPGVSRLLTGGAASITSLLKSPAVFTGKDGIKSVTDLLNNPVKQAGIQQELMSQGVAGLKALGVPTDLLSPQGLAGTALNAAKSIPGADAFLKGLPIPNDPAGAVAAAFNANIRDGAFAANLSQAKIPPAFKAEITPVPSADTVNRDTVNAAVTRVLGNPKVPEPNYGPLERPPGLDAEVTAALTKASTAITEGIATTNQAILRLTANVASLESRQTITAQEWEVINNERVQVGAKYNTTILPVRRSFNSLLDATTKSIQQEFAAINKLVGNEIQELVTNANALKTRVNELAKKIQDGGGE
jgi:hypothetical protein